MKVKPWPVSVSTAQAAQCEALLHKVRQSVRLCPQTLENVILYLIDTVRAEPELAQIIGNVRMIEGVDGSVVQVVPDRVGNIEKGNIYLLVRWDPGRRTKGWICLVFYSLADLFGDVPLIKKHGAQLGRVQHLDKKGPLRILFSKKQEHSLSDIVQKANRAKQRRPVLVVRLA